MASPIREKYNCAVYLNRDLLTRPLREISPQIKAPQIIGDLWARAMLCKNDIREIKPLLGRLGVSESDKEAHEVLIPLMEMACSDGVEITPSEDDSGVYFLSKKGEKFAIFKVGTRRMCTESLARKVALKLGVEKHVIPGVYCSIANPALPEDEILEELWNGNVKIIKKPSAKQTEAEPLTLTGVLEPYIASDDKITADEMASMTVYAFLVGMRDAKKDSKRGARFVDVEDIMPLRLLPGPGLSPNKSVASTHLPYLADRLAHEQISLRCLKEIAMEIDTVSSHVFKLLGELELEKVEFADCPSERLMGFKDGVRPPKEHKGKNLGVDHGGMAVQVIEQKRIMEEHPRIDISKTDRLLHPDQLAAFYDRAASLKRFITLCVNSEFLPSSMDIITNADEMYGAHLQALKKHNPARVQGAADLIGFYPPSATRSPLEPEDRERIIQARKTPSPSDLVRSGSGSSSRDLFSDSSVGIARIGSEEELRTLLTRSGPVSENKMEE